MRQLDHLRATIYERAGNLAELLDKGFKMTKSHINNFISVSKDKNKMVKKMQDGEVVNEDVVEKEETVKK